MKNRPSGVPEGGSRQSPNWRYTGTGPVPWAYEMPRRKDMAERLGWRHGLRRIFSSTMLVSAVLASPCSRVVLMCLTVRATTGRRNVFIPRSAVPRDFRALRAGLNAGRAREYAPERPQYPVDRA